MRLLPVLRHLLLHAAAWSVCTARNASAQMHPQLAGCCCTAAQRDTLPLAGNKRSARGRHARAPAATHPLAAPQQVELSQPAGADAARAGAGRVNALATRLRVILRGGRSSSSRRGCCEWGCCWHAGSASTCAKLHSVRVLQCCRAATSPPRPRRPALPHCVVTAETRCMVAALRPVRRLPGGWRACCPHSAGAPCSIASCQQQRELLCSSSSEAAACKAQERQRQRQRPAACGQCMHCLQLWVLLCVAGTSLNALLPRPASARPCAAARAPGAGSVLLLLLLPTPRLRLPLRCLAMASPS